MSSAQRFYNIQYKLQDLGLIVTPFGEPEVHPALLEIAGRSILHVTTAKGQSFPKDAIAEILASESEIGLTYKYQGTDFLIVTFLPYQCPRCYGYGSQPSVEEHGQRGEDPCYHCGTTGRISNYQHVSNLFGLMISHLAEAELNRQQDSHDPNDEGWSLLAAENQMSEWQYAVQLKETIARRIEKEFSHLTPYTLMSMMDLLVPDTVGIWANRNRTPVTKSSDPMVLQMTPHPHDPIDDDDEDIPF